MKRTVWTLPVVLLPLLAACSEPEAEVTPPVTVTYTSVVDDTGTGFYTVGRSATGTTDQFGPSLNLDIAISNANGIKFSPVAVIEFADGSTVTCEVDDVRRVPSLVKTTTDVDLPCDGALQDDPEATITVTDAYA